MSTKKNKGKGAGPSKLDQRDQLVMALHRLAWQARRHMPPASRQWHARLAQLDAVVNQPEPIYAPEAEPMPAVDLMTTTG